MSQDIFQFYAGSADAAPGKGAGETLVSPASTYTELRKVKDWRRQLSSENPLDSLLLLTGSAQLWEAQPRKPKKRREDLETKREELKSSSTSSQTMEEASAPVPEAPAPKTTRKRAPAKPKNPAAVSSVPEAAVAGEVAPAEVTVAPPDLETAEPANSTLKFCPTCRNYLYMQVEMDPDGDPKKTSHFRLCRCCGFRDNDEKGGLLSEILIQERSSEGYKILLNEHTRKDPRLPHIRGVMKCPSAECRSNGGGVESDIIYMKYDSVNLLYLYICDVCGMQWRSRR